jgi:hypothetical protein
MLQNGIEMVAAAVQKTLFEDGCEFRLIEYHPSRDILRRRCSDV